MTNGSDSAEQDVRAEFASLRAEVERRATIQQALVVLNLTAMAGLTRAVTSSSPNAGASLKSDRGFFLAVLIPFVSFALGHLWIDNDAGIARIGSYIRRRIEPRRRLGWEEESRLYRRDGRSVRYTFTHIVIFVFPGAIALIATAPRVDGHLTRALMWIVGAVLTVVSGMTWGGRARDWRARDEE
jgi:hypothetical protein